MRDTTTMPNLRPLSNFAIVVDTKNYIEPSMTSNSNLKIWRFFLIDYSYTDPPIKAPSVAYCWDLTLHLAPEMACSIAW